MMRDYRLDCPTCGARAFIRLDTSTQARYARCRNCGATARVTPLPPPR
jgi:predicted RNA-binding Zn-ribbon protein involved in translation (DUF1610 family)